MKVSTIIKKVVLLQGAVPGSLHHQMRLDSVSIELSAFVDDVPVADSVQAVAAASVGDEAREGQAGAGVGDDGGAGVLLEDDGGHEGDELIAVDGVAVLVDDAAAVNVRVEDDPEIGVGLEDGGACEGHGGLVLRVGDVVGKHAVRVEVEGSERVGA